MVSLSRGRADLNLWAMPAPQGHQCKGCGLLVQPGYPRCPRCTMPLPENKVRAETIAAGGTSVASESHMSLWLGLGGLVLVVAGVAYASMSGGDTKSGPEPATTEAALELAPDEAATTPQPPSEDNSIGFTGEDEPPTADELRDQAIATLRQMLQEKRLWSTISDDGETLSLVSGACSDAAMRPTLTANARSLSEVGFARVRCLEKHGEQVFEQGL